jgi:tetratricopeptide (TPR) repeat protein
LLQKYGKHPHAPQATFERAKVLALQKDVNGAINELKKFSGDPLKKSTIAPLALLHLSTLQRSQNQAAAAATTLAECRKEHEDALNRDPSRSGWVLLLRYHHAVALREAGKLDEARGLFDTVAKSAADRPEAWDAALRAGQSQKEDGQKKIADAQKQLGQSNLKPDQRGAAEKRLADGMQDLRNAANYLTTTEQAFRNRKVAAEDQQRTMLRTRGRMLYEAAWAWRDIARMEQAAARKKIQLDRWQKRRDEVAKLTQPGQTPPAVALPEVDIREVPVQPGETQARKVYRDLIAALPDLTINADARFELAELLADRNEHDDAVKLLQGALEGEKEPSAELTDRIKVRLASCLLDRGVRRQLDGKRKLAQPNLKPPEKAAAQKLIESGGKDVESALEQVQTVTANDKSAMLAHATYREAECQLHLGKADEAIKLLAKFRDHGPFQNLPGLTDRALLRLGFALGEKKQWDASRQAYERVVGSFGNGPWAHQARYGIGWAYQNKGDYDNAVNTYTQVTSAVATRLAARAQLNIGLCRLMQKRYSDATTALLVVPFTYNYPALSALALVEAARAFHENKQTGQAVKLLRRVVKDHPGTVHAQAARKRLVDLGEES